MIKYQSIDTGKFIPDRWIVYYENETLIDDADKDILQMTLVLSSRIICIDTSSRKFH